MIRKNIFLSILIFFSSNAFAFNLSNFEVPESIIVDPEDGTYYVSNINGELAAKDGNGYISKIGSNRAGILQKFIVGTEESPLHAPKGLLISGKTLYVTDIDTLKGYEKDTGKQIFSMPIESAQFLNDIVMDAKGLIYISDTLANQIFRVDPKTFSATVFKSGEELGQPNGLIIDPKTKNLVVVTWKTGEILEINAKGEIKILKKSLSALDGVDYDNENNLYVSSFEKGEIYKIPNFGQGDMTTFSSGLVSPADISIDRQKNEILVPSFNGNEVFSVSLKKS